MYYWWRKEPGLLDVEGFGMLHGTGFDAFRAEIRAVPDDTPRL
ncbi:hypothetical protein [Actinomadura sp. B10D3]